MCQLSSVSFPVFVHLFLCLFYLVFNLICFVSVSVLVVIFYYFNNGYLYRFCLFFGIVSFFLQMFHLLLFLSFYKCSIYGCFFVLPSAFATFFLSFTSIHDLIWLFCFFLSFFLFPSAI